MAMMFYVTGGCIVSDERQRVKITGYTGGSVVLPCSCADSQSTATTVTWEFEQGNRWIQVFEDEKYNDRRVLFNEHSPTNLSLLITDLRMNDQGYYRCLTESNTFTDVDLNVKDVFILLGVFFSVLLLALLAFIWWRCRGGRNEKKATTVAEEQKREQDNQDDVMYSAVAYVKTTSTPAHTHNDPAEFTEYARINVKR
ncbi:polymeric immunoglobulin receptor-like protein [Labeo rohita]|nr:polymeric immunoglobulin receptor-like protein [Labeo rohita]